MLAYLFWHWPGPTVERADYEARLRRFHEAIRAVCIGSAVFRCEGLPWAEGIAYEDWYLVEDFTALGALNEAAVQGARSAPHDDVARLARDGAGGVYKLVHPERSSGVLPNGVWVRKPAGMPYVEFFDRIDAGMQGHEYQLWQRQLTLGPALEFCLRSAAPVEIDWAPYVPGAGQCITS